MTDVIFKQMKAKPFLFLHGRKETGFAGIGEAGKEILAALEPFMRRNGIKGAGAGVWSYTQLGDGKVLLRAGVPIQEGPESRDGFFVTQEEEWKCVSMEYPGSMAGIGNAWDRFIEAMKKAGLVPSKENREIYHKWVGMDSADNVTELQMRLG